MKKVFYWLVLFFAATITFAHEVYVLSPIEIDNSLKLSPLNLLAIALSEPAQFFISGLVAILLVVGTFALTLSDWFRNHFGDRLRQLSLYSAVILQITFGVALIVMGHRRAAFGPELPFHELFGSYQTVIAYLIMLAGIFILLGAMVRQSSVFILAVFSWLIYLRGVYMLNYGIYVVEATILLMFGSSYVLGGSKRLLPIWLQDLMPYKYLFLRIGFGISLLFAAFYAKWYHGALALNTVIKYGLDNYFPFDPSFIVLGAFIVEVVIAVFLIFGFHTRFITLLYLGFLIQSVLFFKEAVWPHIILLGTTVGLFCHGYDRYAIESLLKKHRTEESS
jgi:hypothetical protein